ncbi:hypothetical protein K435DRAFT_216770 [Dendrothele bispora CBS 962.96]|uniref:Uncharacterized protein n=1 Tax=Dendrothele bispora (strain CBS 962.96) TaxID=1314807 RepID=A0A4S8LSU7_DENBC|nr:hypothetical protein K435DRAFT_216770 [Dendrothele bispora CBS 962.96]
MPKSLNLRQLISQPLGPYPESLILSESFPRKGSGFVPRLSSVYIDANKRASGLDYTEFVGVAPGGLPHVRFFGILEIENLSWLSDTGRECLQTELRERDGKLNRLDESSRSGLTLERLYGSRPGEGSKICVWLCCEKNVAAAFLTTDRHQSSLILYSRSQNATEKPVYRTYEAVSLDVQTYAKSRNFFERFRLLAFLKTLLDESTAPCAPPPLEDRTMSWLAEYMLLYHRTQTKYHRHLPKLTFSSSNDGGNLKYNDSDMDSEGNTSRPRYPRHISTSEVYSILATHAEWLLAAQLATSDIRHHYMNLVDLYIFCRKVAGVRGKDGLGFVSLREKARRRKPDLKWGWGMEYRDPFEREERNARETVNELDLTRFGGTRQSWADQIRRWCMKLRKHDPIVFGPPVIMENEYDSDFTVDSSPPASDSDEPHSGRGSPSHSDLISGDTYTRPDSSILRKRFPTYCFDPPTLLPGRFHWYCPHVYGPEDFSLEHWDDYSENDLLGKQCEYSINLLEITEENFRKSPTITRRDFEYMRDMKWKTTEPLAFSASPSALTADGRDSISDRRGNLASYSRARGIFVDMVSDHYKDHLRGRGIVFAENENRDGRTNVKVELIEADHRRISRESFTSRGYQHELGEANDFITGIVKDEDIKMEDVKMEDIKTEDIKTEDIKTEDIKMEDIKMEDMHV